MMGGSTVVKQIRETIEDINFIGSWVRKVLLLATSITFVLGMLIWETISKWDPIWIALAALVVFALILAVFVLMLLIVLTVFKLRSNKIVLSYKNNEPPFFDFIEGYRKFRIALKVSTREKLRHVMGAVLSIRKLDGAKWSDCIVHNTPADLGWPRGEKSHEPIDIDTEDYLILFLGSEEGNKLKLFTNVDYLYYKPLQDPEGQGFPPGKYQIDIHLKADGIDVVKKTVQLNWTGNIKDFHMELL